MFNKNSSCFLLGLFLLFSLAMIVRAEEGMYLLDQIDPALMQKMQQMGLQLTLDQIYNPNGTGIANAVLNMGGGTAAFVSPKGLIITNHHVAFGAIARISSAENNYIEKGFLAKTMAEEVPAPGYQILVLIDMKDITNEILSAIKPTMTNYQRYLAIEKRTKEIIKVEEKKGDIECRIEAMSEGMQFYLFRYFKIKDIRIVYVPPDAVGNYGGEIDNWMWPRHAGDFSFMRAYVSLAGKPAEFSKDNVPYQPKAYLKISQEGIKEGDLGLLIGYPGRTSRHRTSYGIAQDVEFRLPFQIKIAADVIKIFEDFSNKDKEAAVKLSLFIKGFANTYKNNEGVLKGLKEIKMLEKKQNEEKEFLGYLATKPELNAKYGNLLPEIKKIYEESDKIVAKNSLLRWMSFGSPLFNAANVINKWSIEQLKRDIEREPGFQDRDLPQIKMRLEVLQKSLVPEADRKACEYFLKTAMELPLEKRLQSIEIIFSQNIRVHSLPGQLQVDPAFRLSDYLEKLYSTTKLTSAEERLKMLGMPRKELLKLNDPFIQFASQLEDEREALRKKEKELAGTIQRVIPVWLEGIKQWQNTAFYHDANSTMRLNYGQVKGYAKKDAIAYRYITTLKGLVEKNTGNEPFNCPETLLTIFKNKDYGNYLDKNVNDVPVDFLTTSDSTGGNSGSPIMNGKGEIIGLLFDGNYDALYSDYYFDPVHTRSINVDIRYVLFIAEKLNNAKTLLEELNIK